MTMPTEVAIGVLTKRLMRHFDERHHRFLVDYGWEDVARFVLTKPAKKKSRRK